MGYHAGVGGTVVVSEFNWDADLVPDTDDAHDLGSPSQRVQAIIGQLHQVFAAAGDANPVTQVDGDGVKFGPGGASATDLQLIRLSPFRLEVRDDGGAVQGLRAKLVEITQQILADAGNSVLFNARNTSDTAVTVATLNRAATPTFDIDQGRIMPNGGFNTETLSANKTLVVNDAMFQKLDPGGSNRDVTLPAEAAAGSAAGGCLAYLIANAADAAEDLVVKNDAGTIIATLNQDEAAWFVCNGTTWEFMGIETIGQS